jgi:hypothetical protein
VLEGELALTAGGRELRAPAGSWAHVPPGRPARRLVPRPGALPERAALGCRLGAFVRALDGDEERAAARAGSDQRPS